jgi:hypothetical protein
VDLIADNWKKYPLLVIGELPIALPEAFPFSAAGANGQPVNNFYVLVSVSGTELGPTLAKLEEAGLCAAQILPMLRPEEPFSHPRQAFLGLFDLIEGESPEEFRTRLLGKLEGQRQKMLSLAFQEAADLGLARQLSEIELSAALDSCRVAHALACGYSFSPLAHLRVLRRCLEPAACQGAWPADISAERLIVETSRLLVLCFRHSHSFREQLKEKGAALPFRARSDLLHQVETTLGHLLGGKSNVA